jgi:DNA-directed RNA polymerase subunit A'
VPQTEEAQVEAEMLMKVENHIRSPRYGLPIITCKHDHITGCYMLTKKETKFSRKDAARLLMAVGVEDFEEADEYTGKEIFSYTLPKDLNISFRASFADCKCTSGDECEHDNWVVIKNGILKKGVIDDNALGEKKGKLIDMIEKNYSPVIAREFIDHVSRLSLEVVSMKGFSISISDEDVNERVKASIKKVVEDYEAVVDVMIKDYRGGHLEKIAGMTPEMTLENKILRLGGQAANDANHMIRKSMPVNSAVIMARTGARGSFVNLAQMCAIVGQEALEGERIHRGFLNRTLSHFKQHDLGLVSHGFVSHGYKEGLQPFEFFFDAMNSRENLMDKSLHTRHSGYMERRLVNALQDLRVEYDGTVRDSRSHVIQFLAGEDGIDPAKSDGGEVRFDKVFGDKK